MKNKLFLLVTLLSLVLAFSCSTETSNDLQPQNKLILLNKLENFNISYQNKIDKQPKLSNKINGFWSSLGSALLVAGADIVGAGAGASAVQAVAAGLGVATAGTGYIAVTAGAAAIAGAGASVAAYRGIEKSQYSSKIEYYKNLPIDYPYEFKYMSNIGHLHNKIVFDFYNTGNFFNKTNNDNYTDILSSDDWKLIEDKINKSVNIYVSSDYNPFILTKSLYKKGLINKDSEDVLNLFFNIYNNSENDLNITEIINYYISTIAKSEYLNVETKQSLISAFSVASESPYFWLNQN